MLGGWAAKERCRGAASCGKPDFKVQGVAGADRTFCDRGLRKVESQVTRLSLSIIFGQ